MDVQVTVVPTSIKSSCAVCETSFIQVIGKGSVQLYCSHKCREEARRKRKAKFLAEQQAIATSNMTAEERTRMTELEELVDGCYIIIELHATESPAQETCKRDWLAKAKRLVPSAPEW